MVIILFGNIIIVRKSDLKKFNYKEPKKNKDILSEFLKFMVSRYKEAKIIKSENDLFIKKKDK